MEISIRKFKEKDIPYKVKWVNDKANNQFLHYDLPLEVDRTFLWFEKIKNKNDRADYTIIVNEKPVGLIGLLNVDQKNRKAEYYIILGETEYKGKGVAKKASQLLINESCNVYNLNKIYLYTEVKNFPAQHLFESIGFIKEGLLKEDLIQKNKKIDRFFYSLFIEEYLDKGNK